MTPPKLERCPFCGGTAKLWERNNEKGRMWKVFCRSCNSATPYESFAQNVIDQWNRRADTDSTEDCPFCGAGSRLLWNREKDKCRMICRVCGCAAPFCTTKTETRSIWTKRV